MFYLKGGSSSGPRRRREAPYWQVPKRKVWVLAITTSAPPWIVTISSEYSRKARLELKGFKRSRPGSLGRPGRCSFRVARASERVAVARGGSQLGVEPGA